MLMQPKSVPLTRPRGTRRFMLLSLAPISLHILATAAMAVYTSWSGRSIRFPTTLSVYGAFVLAMIVCVIIAAKWKITRLRRLIEHNGRLCLDCAYPLPPEVERGVCPECGRAYELAASIAAWGKLAGRK